MRRDKRPQKNKMDIKKVLYISGGVLLVLIIAIVLIVVTRSNSSDNLAKINTTSLDEYISDNEVESEEASLEMDKTVNEVQEDEAENDISTNSVNNTTNNVSQKSGSLSNTTNVVSKNTTTATTTSSSSTKTEEEEEEVKDPEFEMPVEGEIIKEFSVDSLIYSTTLDEWTVHNGIDIAAEKTTVVKAAADGTVKSIKNDPRYGLTVVIEHVNGYQTVYSNLLTAEFIEEGETVESGQTIATVGNTATFEISDESHLHFELLKDNEYLDPELYIN